MNVLSDSNLGYSLRYWLIASETTGVYGNRYVMYKAKETFTTRYDWRAWDPVTDILFMYTYIIFSIHICYAFSFKLFVYIGYITTIWLI